MSQKIDYYNVSDESNNMLGGSNSGNGATSSNEKSTLEQIYDKLDKIIAVLLLIVLIYFMVHSFSTNSKDLALSDSILKDLNEINTLEKDSLSKNIDEKHHTKNTKRKHKNHKKTLEDDTDQQDLEMEKSSSKKRGKGNKHISKNQDDSEEQIIKPKIPIKKGKKHISKNQDDSEEQQIIKPKNPIKKAKKQQESDDDEIQVSKKPVIKKKKELESDESDQKPIQPIKKHNIRQQQQSESEQQKKQITPVVKKSKNPKLTAYLQRTNYFKSKESFTKLELLKLAKYNKQFSGIDLSQKSSDFAEQKERIQNKYNLNEYSDQQLSICAVIYAQPKAKKLSSHEYVINSILNQQYSKYKIVYIGDGLNGEEIDEVRSFIKQKKIPQKKIEIIWNTEFKGYAQSHYKHISQACHRKKLTVLLNGQDELLGSQVFSLVNYGFHKYESNALYTNFIEYHHIEQQLKLGFSSQYDKEEKENNRYRGTGQKFGSLKSFKTKLMNYIREEDLKDKSGNFFKFAGDYALYYPLLELSCGKVSYIPEHNYLYFGYEIDPKFGNIQISSGRQIRQKERYSCYKNY